MTDARLPGRWLMDPTIRTLSPDLWTVFSWALMWSAEQGTDGMIPRAILALMHPHGATPEHADALVRAGLWEAEGDGYRVREWSRSQSLAADVEHQRERNRRKQQAYRERAREEGNVTGYVTGESPRRGEARPSEGDQRTRARTRETPDERFQRLMTEADSMDSTTSATPPPASAAITSWPTREVPA